MKTSSKPAAAKDENHEVETNSKPMAIASSNSESDKDAILAKLVGTPKSVIAFAEPFWSASFAIADVANTPVKSRRENKRKTSIQIELEFSEMRACESISFSRCFFGLVPLDKSYGRRKETELLTQAILNIT